MKLISLSLRQFRSFESCDLEFPDGLIGVRGANGTGKSTIAEAIGWALFGSFRPNTRNAEVPRQGGDGPTTVELHWRIDETVYRVKRTLGGPATFWIGDATEPESTQTRSTNAAITRELGVTWETFQRTVFARQKDIAALDPALSGPARTRNVERLLGLSRFERAERTAKGRCKEIATELKTLRETAPPMDELRRELADARAAAAEGDPAVAHAKDALTVAQQTQEKAAVALEDEPARAAEAAALRQTIADHARALTDLAVDLEQRRRQATERVQSQAALAELLAAPSDLPGLRAHAASWDQYARTLAELDSLGPRPAQVPAGAPDRAQRLTAVREEIDELSTSALPDLEGLRRRVAALEACDGLPTTAEASDDARRIGSDRDDARGELAAARSTLETDVAHLASLETNGADEPCPICLRPCGEDFGTIREQHERRIADGRSTVEALMRRTDELDRSWQQATKRLAASERAHALLAQTAGPHVLADARDAAEAAALAVTARSTSLAALREELDLLVATVENDRATSAAYAAYDGARETAQARCDAAAAALGVEAYVEDERAAAHAAVTSAEVTEARRVNLEAALAATETVESDLALLEQRHAERTTEHASAEAALTAMSFDPGRLDLLRAARDVAVSQTTAAQDALQEAKLLAQGSDQAVATLVARVAEAEPFHAQIAEKAVAEREHREAAKLLGEFRTAKSALAWPSLEREAAALLNETTEGRYGDVRMTEDFKIEVNDRGTWFGLERFSGGEQDLANLCLRLAIANWVSRGRDTELGFLVLDEVFGSQDEDRRQRLLVALKSLEVRFHQLLVITHVPEIADLCDHQLLVSQPAAGRSVAEIVSA